MTCFIFGIIIKILEEIRVLMSGFNRDIICKKSLK